VNPKEALSKPSNAPMTDEEFRAALLAPRPRRDTASALPKTYTRSSRLEDLLDRALQEIVFGGR
jgi:hypothetical protein